MTSIDFDALFAGFPCCQCGHKREGYSLNPDTGYWVCTLCKRPTAAFMEQCENCDKWWLPEHIVPADERGTFACPKCCEKLGL